MISSRRKSGCVLFCLVFFLSILFLAKSSQAETFFVPEDTDLQSALNEAGTNNEADVIKLVQSDMIGSNYVGNFVCASTESNSLTIEGGCMAGCASRVVDPANTVLDAENSGRVLSLIAPVVIISSNHSISLDGQVILADEVDVSDSLIINNHSQNDAGGLTINSPTITLRKNTITENISDNGDGGGLYLEAQTIELRSNNVSHIFG